MLQAIQTLHYQNSNTQFTPLINATPQTSRTIDSLRGFDVPRQITCKCYDNSPELHNKVQSVSYPCVHMVKKIRNHSLKNNFAYCVLPLRSFFVVAAMIHDNDDTVQN